jgi:hypothetical protein
MAYTITVTWTLNGVTVNNKAEWITFFESFHNDNYLDWCNTRPETAIEFFEFNGAEVKRTSTYENEAAWIAWSETPKPADVQDGYDARKAAGHTCVTTDSEGNVIQSYIS